MHANGVDLCVECIGDPADPPILLIMGSSASMDWWEDEFCMRLVAGRRFVVRYDHRDTGQSVSYEPGAPTYTLDDLVADPAALIDRLDLSAAHIVGISMGGALAQGVALGHPGRVASLTLIATAPQLPDPKIPTYPRCRLRPSRSSRSTLPTGPTEAQHRLHDPPRADLPRGAPTHSTRLRSPARRTGLRPHAEHGFDDDQPQRPGGGERTREGLGQIDVPTLVVHGTDDPVVPYGNALALVREIRSARLLTLEGAGHDLPRPVWDIVVPAILDHTGV